MGEHDSVQLLLQKPTTGFFLELYNDARALVVPVGKTQKHLLRGSVSFSLLAIAVPRAAGQLCRAGVTSVGLLGASTSAGGEMAAKPRVQPSAGAEGGIAAFYLFA